jgi:predicted nucleotidyltransferase
VTAHDCAFCYKFSNARIMMRRSGRISARPSVEIPRMDAMGAGQRRTQALSDREAIRSALARGVERAGVFGSVARGEDTENSDLGLIVAFRPGARRDLVGISDELEALTGLTVDVVDRDRVVDRVKRTGVGYRILPDTVPL